ncbi:recombinase family protein [Nocardia sp. NPDC058519]|uniref:recombinase family protein n=1 Tax=Nocardia sp. NPDC058519 TaxID=3346535 RepID=UPI00365AFCBF
MSDDDFLRVEAHDCPMSSCAAPAGSPCRTGKGKVAIGYHTARFRLVPSLAKALKLPTPALRRPGAVWTELPRPTAAVTDSGAHVRIGYARASTVRQSLDTQLDSLRGAGIGRIFSEKISTRALVRPELDKAVALAREIRASGAAITLVVHEHKRLGRGIELAALAEQLKAADIGLEFLTGELQGSHDPSGVVFTVLAALSGMEREYIRDRTLEGHESARGRGKSIGGVSVVDETMLAMALHLRASNHSLRDIAERLVITTGKKRGQHPSPATVMRLLRDHDQSMGGDAEHAHAVAELAAVLDRLPADTRPGLPTVERYDDLLPSRRRSRESVPEREQQAAQELSVRRLVRQVIEPGEVFEVGDLLARLARLGLAMTPDKVSGILDYWAARSQLTLIRPGVYRRPLEPDDAA